MQTKIFYRSIYAYIVFFIACNNSILHATPAADEPKSHECLLVVTETDATHTKSFVHKSEKITFSTDRFEVPTCLNDRNTCDYVITGELGSSAKYGLVFNSYFRPDDPTFIHPAIGISRKVITENGKKKLGPFTYDAHLQIQFPNSSQVVYPANHREASITLQHSFSDQAAAVKFELNCTSHF